eukprot:16435764-Heterocapsa_arctica.AAC.1
MGHQVGKRDRIGANDDVLLLHHVLSERPYQALDRAGEPLSASQRSRRLVGALLNHGERDLIVPRATCGRHGAHDRRNGRLTIRSKA